MWEILGIEPTTDIRAIKSAYARLAKKYNPEEQPEEFQRLHAAYKQASDFARRINSLGKNQKTGDGVDFSALSRTEKKSEKPQTEFDFSEVDDSKRTHEEALPQDKNEFVFPPSEQKREEASDEAADDFDFSSINTDNMEISDEER
ncbi:MAG: J domain-containing protein, partial [Huintestinicola sp.]